MKKLFVAYLSYLVWFFVACFLGAVIFMGLSLLSYDLQLGISPLYFFRPSTSGLRESIGYTLTLGGGIGVFSFTAILLFFKWRHKTRFATPWIIAGIIELSLAVTSLANMSFGEYPYVLSQFIESGWPQLPALILLVVSFIYYLLLLRGSGEAQKAK